MKKYLLMLPALLAACTPHSDLQEWMHGQKEEASRSVVKSSPLEPPEIVAYNPPIFTGLHAFDNTRLNLARKDGQGPSAPDMDRAKEILEGFGLDKIKYVGSLKRNNRWLAFVRVENHVYTVKVGNHMGFSYGEVVDITPDKIVLRETIQNTEGNWIHRPAEIPLSIN